MMNYEESVRWLRSQPEKAEMVKNAYLDEDNHAAAVRFRDSEEFTDLRKLLGLVPDAQPTLHVLDLGCGNGLASFCFASSGCRVSALDPDPSNDVGLGATERLRQTLPRPDLIETKIGFAESLPYPDNSFDVIYTRQAVHHFQDLSRAFAECYRTLKPGGRLLATREHVVDDAAQLAVFLEEHALHHLHGGENAFPLETYLSAIKSSGLRVQKLIRPYDSVINHFPNTNTDVHRALRSAAQSRLGDFLGGLIAELPGVESFYRSRLSLRRDAGRFFSFLALKPA